MVSHITVYLSTIRWAKSKRTNLDKIGSSLEFKLHRLQFIDMLVGQQQQAALVYARTHFAEFATTQMLGMAICMSKATTYPHIEIQKLMGAFLYSHRLGQSPYADMFQASHMPALWDDIIAQFTRDSCSLLGLPQESPLHVWYLFFSRMGCGYR